ncbi:MAG: hypothetical protein KC635_02700, partial [Myxococcales bacterium]|nr:hypothetical protein [Myxococcales bacterium]
ISKKETGLTARPLGGDGAAAVIVATRAFDPAVVLGVDAAVSVRGVLGTRLHVTRDVNVENRFPHAARLAEHVVWDLATHGVVATDAEPAMCGAGPGERDEAAAALATDDPLGRAAATIAGEARCVEVTLRAAGGEPRVERRFAIASDYVDQDGVWGTYTRSTVVSRPAPTRGPGAPPALALAYLAATGRDGRFGWTYPPTDPTARARALAAFEAGGGARGGR